MLTNITVLSAKDIQFLQPHKSIKWAQRQLATARTAIDSRVLTVQHLADFWGVDDSDIINGLKPRFGAIN